MSSGQKDKQTQPYTSDTIPEWLSQMAPDNPGRATPAQRSKSISRKWVVAIDATLTGALIGALVGRTNIVTEYGIVKGISYCAIWGTLMALLFSRKLSIILRIIMGVCVGVITATIVSTVDIGTLPKMVFGATIGVIVAVIFGVAAENRVQED